MNNDSAENNGKKGKTGAMSETQGHYAKSEELQV